MAGTNQQFIYNLTAKIDRIKNMTDTVTSKVENKSPDFIDSVYADVEKVINREIEEIRKSIIKYARGQYCALLDLIEPLLPLVNLNIIDLGSVINAVKSVISIMLGPYYKALQAEAELLASVVQLSNALVSMVSYISSKGINVTVNPITPSEITNCPVVEGLSGDFDNFPTIA